MPGIGDKLMTASEIKEVTDTKLDKDFSSLDTSGGFSLSDTIPVNISGTTYKITGQTLSNAIGGGGGTQQASLTNYVKNCGTISVLPVTLTDSNITSDMIVIEYTIGDETALGSDWTVTTADGSLTISGTLNKSTTLQLVLSVGYSTTPSILTNLASDTADNVLKASPRPGVTGVLPLTHGGVGSSTASGARTNLSVYSKAETDSAIAESTADKAQKIFFDVASWDNIYNKLSSLTDGPRACLIMIGTAVVSFMTGGAVPSGALVGIVGLTNSTVGRYTFWATHHGSNNSFMWEIYGLTSASSTPTIINLKKFEPNYISGNTENFDDAAIGAPGFITSDAKSMTFFIDLPKSLADITSISCSRFTGVIRGTKNYVDNVQPSSSRNWASTSGITCNAVKVSANKLRINIIGTSQFANVDNNTPIYFIGNVKFSMT